MKIKFFRFFFTLIISIHITSFSIKNEIFDIISSLRGYEIYGKEKLIKEICNPITLKASSMLKIHSILNNTEISESEKNSLTKKELEEPQKLLDREYCIKKIENKVFELNLK
jgi:hypothetical protein